MDYKHFWVRTIGLLIILGAGFSSSQAQFLNWQYENIVTDLRQSGAYPDMLIDPAGNTHISYWDKNRDLVMYARKDAAASSWSFEPVDPGHQAGYRSALALDDAGKVHIAYYENKNGTAYLRYASNTSGNWINEPILEDSALGKYGFDAGVNSFLELSVDIMIDPESRPVISYFDGSIWESKSCQGQIRPYIFDMDLHLARKRNDGKWDTYKLNQPIMPAPNGCISRSMDRFGEFNKIVNRADSSFLMVTNSLYNHEMLLFTSDSSKLDSWNVMVFDSAKRVMPSNLNPLYEDGFAFSDFMLTDDRYLHISYAFCDAYGLRSTVGFGRPALRNVVYTRIDLDSIGFPAYKPFHHEFFAVPTDNNFRTYISLSAQGRDSVYLSYYDVHLGEVVFSETHNGGNSWNQSVLMSDFSTNASLKLEVYQDSVYVLAYNSRSDQLFLTTTDLSGVLGASEQVSTTERRANYLGSAIERKGGDDRVHIAFDERDEDRLYYGMRSSGNWAYEAIDIAGEGLSYIGLQLDNAGEAYITYLLETPGELRFTYLNGGNRVIETITGTGTPDEFSFAIYGDSAHICYYDRSLKTLIHTSSLLKSGNWSFTQIDTSSHSVGRSPSLVTDPEGNLHVAYRDNDRRLVRYGYRGLAGNWQVENATDSSDYNPFKLSLQLTYGDNHPLIAFRDISNAILITEKMGANWNDELVVPSQTNLIGSPLSLLVDSMDNRWILYNFVTALEELRLQRRTTNGTIWKPVSVINNDAQTAGTFDFHLVEDDFYIIGRKNKAEDQGIGLLFAPEGVTTDLDKESLNRLESSLFPNPAQEFCHISFNLEKSQDLQIKLLDIQGKQIRLLPSATYGQGEHQVKLDLKGLPAGLYFCRIGEGELSSVKKLVISRH